MPCPRPPPHTHAHTHTHTQALLGMAYLIEAMLMGLHKKHTPLDIAEHELLYYTMLATAIAVFMEVK